MKKLLFIFGTRPESIKMAPLVKESAIAGFKPYVCLTGQHEEMIKPFLDFFQIKADYNLNVMKPNQNLAELTSSILTKSFEVIQNLNPDLVIVQGDTTTTMAGALAAFYSKKHIAHIEAGLRTHDRYSPFPEEINRQLVSSLASLHFAPTSDSSDNLLREGIVKNVFICGNTSIDALRISSQLISNEDLSQKYSKIDFSRRIILVTTHRRENHGAPLKNICRALVELSKKNDIEVVVPVHLNPNVREVVFQELGQRDHFHLLPPLDYQDFVFFMKKSYIILTDSGGVQEEAPYFKKPILVLRNNTERPEGVNAGTSVLVGTESENIIDVCTSLLNDQKKYMSFVRSVNPYGDGYSSNKILEEIKNFLNLLETK